MKTLPILTLCLLLSMLLKLPAQDKQPPAPAAGTAPAADKSAEKSADDAKKSADDAKKAAEDAKNAAASAEKTAADAKKQTAAPKFIDFKSGLAYPLAEEGAQLTARIPIGLVDPGQKLNELEIRRQDIYTADERPEQLVQKITTTLEEGSQVAGKLSDPSLLISAKAAELAPASYTLVLEIALKDPALKKAPQSVTLTLTRKAPTLVSTNPISIWQERGFCTTTTTTTGNYINLHEDTKKVAVLGLSFIDSRTPATKPGPATGNLQFTPATADILGGKELRIEVGTLGDYPLGKTTGKIKVRSPQLATPVEVDYEVNSFRTRWWIFVCGLAGLLVGLLLRTVLQGRRDRLAAEVTASAAVAVLVKAQEQNVDAHFRKLVAQAEEALRGAARAASSALSTESFTTQITEAVNTAKAALTAAEADLKERLKLLDAVQPLHELLHRSWHLPPSFAATLVPAVTIADQLQILAAAHDVSTAQPILDVQMPVLMAALATAGNQWRASCSKYLDALAQHTPALPDQGDARLTEAVAGWKKLFGDARTYVVATREELEKELGDTDAAYLSAKNLARDLQAGGVELAQWARSQFDLPAAAACDELVTLAKTRASRLLEQLDKPEENRPTPAQSQIDEMAAWKNALRAVILSGDPAPVMAAIEQGHWSDAVKQAKLLAVPPPQQQHLEVQEVDEQIALDGDHENRAAARAPGSAAPAATTTVSPAPVSGSLGLGFQPWLGASRTAAGQSKTVVFSGSIAERQALAQEDEFLAFVQFIIISGLYIAAAYVLYADTWVGTERDLLNVFAWGLGLDITTSAVTTSLQKFQPPSAK